MFNGGDGDRNAVDWKMNGDAAGAASCSSFVTVHVEVRLRNESLNVNLSVLRAEVKGWLAVRYEGQQVPCETVVEDWRTSLPSAGSIDRIRISETDDGRSSVACERARFVVDAYYAASADDLEELMTGDADGAGEAAREEEAMAATVLELPNAGLEGVWENLIYADGLKNRLMGYIYTTLRYSDVDVDANVIAWNRLLLLHGPPGTGKTSLCRALSHKLAIRLSQRYAYGKLVEVNAHSLFSKWFSESGKLVQRLFSMINEMVADEDALVVVLIDEVESLTAARANASSGAEPGDAVRVVNALLTQLDKLKRRKNVLVVTTSNLSDTIDDAFLDRADIKQYVGPPPPEAIYWILQSCVQELMRVGLVETQAVPSYSQAVNAAPPLSSHPGGAQLAQLAVQLQGLSGRTLRRLPVLAHARYLGTANADEPVPFPEWLDAMQKASTDARKEMQDAMVGVRTSS